MPNIEHDLPQRRGAHGTICRHRVHRRFGAPHVESGASSVSVCGQANGSASPACINIASIIARSAYSCAFSASVTPRPRRP